MVQRIVGRSSSVEIGELPSVHDSERTSGVVDARPGPSRLASASMDRVRRKTPRRSRAFLGVVCALAIVVAACGESTGSASPGSSSPSPGPSSANASPSPSASGAAVATDPASTTPASGPDLANARIELRPLVDGVDNPVDVAAPADDSGRLYVVEQSGRIRLLRDRELDPEPMLDIAERITAGGERGLLGLALHPGFPDDPRAFVDYTDTSGDTVIAEFRLRDGDPDAFDPASERILLRIDQPYPNHNGGAVAFGPDGMLYIGMGDGGSGGDPQGYGRRMDTLLAKILRIGVDPEGERPYTIPPDNPFVGQDGAEPEIWLTGMRNPWRIRFDRSTGDLWIGDVGQGAWEEVDVVDAGVGGLDLGWAEMEGRHCFRSESCDQEGLTLPVAEYSHDEGCSITGGVVYRGAAVPALTGAYLFSDYCSGTIWAIDAAAAMAARPEAVSPTVLSESDTNVSAIGETAEGELVVVSLSGALFEVVAAS